MHENPSAPTTLQRNLIKLGSWKNISLWGLLLLHDFSLTWFVFVIATLEVVLPNHTWNIIISSKLYFVIIKIKINQTLVSHNTISLEVNKDKEIKNTKRLRRQLHKINKIKKTFFNLFPSIFKLLKRFFKYFYFLLYKFQTHFLFF